MKEGQRGQFQWLTSDPEDVVPVRTRALCTWLMVITASLTAMIEVAFLGGRYMNKDNDFLSLWFTIGLLASLVLPFLILRRRSDHPYISCLLACLATLALPFDSLLCLMSLTSMLARRKRLDKLIPCSLLSCLVSYLAIVRDLSQPRKYSFLILFAPHTQQANAPLVGFLLMVLGAAIAISSGIYIRLQATTRLATEHAHAQEERSQQLQTHLSNQQVADAIAVEAHDTLAHSLSLIGLNASALKVEADKLSQETGQVGQGGHSAAHDIAQRAEDIRQQAAGALDETHSVIDMLRHPDEVLKEMQPDPQTALTRPALDDIVQQSRASGMKVDTWIDVQDLSQLDPRIGKIAYRCIQEGLTNARRHAPGQPVSLEVSAQPSTNVHVHISNPLPQSLASAPAAEPPEVAEQPTPIAPGGNGLKGLTARAASCGGHCAFGVDQRGVFNLDLVLPFLTADQQVDS
ncbi:histidine kinase [Bombiscardovia nodaiensis]|uniref:histidine kinase n=1 Tax=Bombiscardovia nodaiensis TaxID=2932181 RepID=A0ABN6SBY2_9BIFI|nr:histidine kinase [Bombiscardovia nodaiensis]